MQSCDWTVCVDAS